MTDPIALTVTREIAAPPERVFDAWLDPALARQFLFKTPGGEMTTREIDPRVGGRAVVVERRASGDVRHHLKFETIDRPRRLAFLFRADPAKEGERTRVAIDFAATGTGTRVALTHDMDVQWAAYEGQTRKGWTMILGTLAEKVETKA